MKLFKQQRSRQAVVVAQPSQADASSAKGNRRELLRTVLRDTLQHHGIPADWIGAELLASTLSTGEHGLHWRLLVKHWDARLATYVVALEDALLARLITVDKTADRWLTGISWQFAVKDRAACPRLPPARTWTGRRVAEPASGDVESARADLNRWLAKKDESFPLSPDTLPPTWAPTQPAKW